ncbi:MAG: hypothetical protein AAGF12_40745 [Myxococcota bacterium]
MEEAGSEGQSEESEQSPAESRRARRLAARRARLLAKRRAQAAMSQAPAMMTSPSMSTGDTPHEMTWTGQFLEQR